MKEQDKNNFRRFSPDVRLHFQIRSGVTDSDGSGFILFGFRFLRVTTSSTVQCIQIREKCYIYDEQAQLSFCTLTHSPYIQKIKNLKEMHTLM